VSEAGGPGNVPTANALEAKRTTCRPVVLDDDEVAAVTAADEAAFADLAAAFEAAHPVHAPSWQPPARELVTSDSGFTLTHIGDLLAEPDETTDWLVDDLLPMGGLGFVAAKPKAGKSTLVRNLAVAVARGGEFLGQSCVQGTVIYLALEEKRSEVRRHFRQLGATPGDPLLVHIAKAPKDALADLLRLIRKHRPVLVIIDPLLRFTRVRDEKAYAELSNALEGVMAAAREWNCCIVATHHSPKAQGVETIDALLGSTALSGAPDTVLVIRRRDQERTAESVQRYGPDMERQLLELDGDGRLGAPGRSADDPGHPARSGHPFATCLIP
jgi:AAA domain